MKKVLITGGSGDIAQAIKRQLEAEGYEVYAPTKVELDVTDWDSIEKAISGFIPDVLINNAGYVVPKSVKKADLFNTKKHIDINLSGTFYCTEIVLKYNPNVDIVNVTSAAAVEKHATWSEYCATKAAVVMATKCWADDGLYAVAVSPARTKTKMRKSLYPEEDQTTLLEPADFAKVISKAVNKEYNAGDHILVRKQTVEDILRGKIDELF